MGLKLLTDFDGVWTVQTEEARSVRRGFVEAAAVPLNLERSVADAEFESFLHAAQQAPERWGWTAPGDPPGTGRLTAFVDEDPVLATISVAGWLDSGAVHPRADAWRLAAEELGHRSVSALATATFGPSMAAHRDSGEHALVPEALDFLESCLEGDIELVVASNSAPEKLHALFDRAGFDPMGTPGLRLVGDARKWQLGAAEAVCAHADREVYVHRPAYEQLLRDERPDVVVGDVFSLDLALPTVMRSQGELASRLVLRVHSHTPAWTRATLAEGLVDDAIDNLNDLRPLLSSAP